MKGLVAQDVDENFDTSCDEHLFLGMQHGAQFDWLRHMDTPRYETANDAIRR